MTVVLTDGFDMYNGQGAGTGLQARYVLGGPSASIGLQGGRLGGQCVRIQTNANQGGTASAQAFLPATYSTVTIGLAWWPITQTSIDTQTFSFIDSAGATSNVSFYHDWTNMQLMVQNAAGTVVASSPAGSVLNNASWHYVEMEIVQSATVGQIRAYLDGAQFCNLTNQNTGANPIQSYAFRANSPGGQPSRSVHLYDDLYVLDVATRLGERRVETLRAAADSAVTWTPNSGLTNFSRVNETLVDGDTSYVQTAGVGNLDLYTIGALSSAPTQIDAVNLVSFAEKTDAGPRSIYHSCKSGGTSSDGSSFGLVTNSYGRRDRLILTDPNTSAAWTYTAVNGLLIGPKLAA